jgi:hypothetical protein
MAGLQVAGTLAQGAAEASAMRRQARAAEQDARTTADALAAEAEFARDRAGRDSAAARARASMSAIDPSSESVVASLSDAHARRMDPALRADAGAGRVLAGADARAAALRRASRGAIYRSLLGSGLNLAARLPGSGVIGIPI